MQQQNFLFDGFLQPWIASRPDHKTFCGMISTSHGLGQGYDWGGWGYWPQELTLQIVIVTCVRINVKLWMIYLLRQNTNPVPYHANVNFMGNIIQKYPGM